MKTRFSSRLWLALPLMLLRATALVRTQVWGKTEIHFWHAMSGHLDDAVNALASRFNNRQQDYAVKSRSSISGRKPCSYRGPWLRSTSS